MAVNKCLVCPFQCKQQTLCGKTRELLALVRREPIESEGFFHVFPGHNAKIIYTPGCNLGCRDCLHPFIFHRGFFNSINSINNMNKGLIILSCSANTDVDRLFNVIPEDSVIGIITHGFLTDWAILETLSKIDFALLTFFGFSEDSYAELTITTRALSQLMKFRELANKSNKFLELRYIVVENINDNREEIIEFIRWTLEISDSIPVHFKRFFSIESKRAPTRNERLLRAYKLAKAEGLKFVYIDDFYKHESKNTYLNGELVIRRVGFNIEVLNWQLLEKIPILGNIMERRGFPWWFLEGR